MTGRGEFRVGTSGWNYGDWQERFYPPDLKSSKYLQWYAQHFDTVEVNYSFYHLPRPTTYENWAKQVPDHFIFAVKVSRFITHIKRLDGVQEEWKKFLENASALGAKLGPILLQFPPSFKIDQKALRTFLEKGRGLAESMGAKLAFEFRHASWFDPEVLETLREFRTAAVVAQSQRYPQAPAVPTASFMYLRFHGPGELFASSYSAEELKQWSTRIKEWLSAGKSVYVYFNNDFHAHAIVNARQLGGFVASAARAVRR